MRDFRRLKVWEKAHGLVLKVYQATCAFPKDETYGLTSQTRRACVSIAANIAEGCVKLSEAEFARYLVIAMGSSSELEYELLLARDLGYLSEEAYEDLQNDLVEVRKMLNGLIQKLTASH